MVQIYTGPINSGKTTRIKDFYKNLTKAEGFISRKIFQSKQIIGYDLVRLTDGKSKILARIKSHSSLISKKSIQVGKFIFSEKGFIFGYHIIKTANEKNIENVFLDEIGPLEIIHHKGFYKLLKQQLKKENNIHLTVRDNLLKDLIKTFEIKKYKIYKRGKHD